MSEVRQGRWTASIDGDFVVFLIGARIQASHPMRSLRDLSGVKRGMQGMLKYLGEHPEKGLLGWQQLGFGTANVQYWRSFEHLERFAQDQDDPHLAAWRAYWRRVGRSDRTGIWHETYLVRAGEYEAIYGNMPPFGLGRATDLVRLGSEAGARARLRNLAG
jgi:fumigallin biosynthesis monooxygenase-like protein